MKTKILAISIVLCLGLMSIPYIEDAEGGVFTYNMDLKKDTWNFKSYPNQTTTYSPVLFNEIPNCTALSGKNATSNYWYTYWPDVSLIENWTILPGDGLFVLTTQDIPWNVTIEMGYTRGDLWVDGNFSVSGDSEMDYNVTVNGSMTVDGNFEVNTLTVTGDLDANGNLTVNDNLIIGNNLTINGTLTVVENITVSGNLSVTQDVSVGGDFDISGSATITGDLTVTGDILGTTGRTATFTISANDSSALSKAQADYVCNGSDDDVEIRYAIDALSPYPRGGKVFLHAGQYNITSTIEMRGGVTLEGENMETTIIRVQSSLNASAINVTSVDASHQYFSRITNLKIYGYLANENNVGIFCQESGEGGGVYDNYIDHVFVYQCGSNGIQLKHACSWGTKIESCVVEYCGGQGIRVNSPSNQLIISNCFIAYNEGDYGVSFDTSRAKFIGNSVFQNDFHGLLIYSNSDKNIVSGNIFQGNGDAGTGDGIYLDTIASDNIITDNIIEGDSKTRYGINVNSDNNLIKDNVILECVTSSINNVGGNNSIEDNIGYIAPGEIRTASGSLTAGVANAICFAWHNPELQDIFIRKVVIEVTTAGGTADSLLDVGIADDATGTNRGTEFFDDLGLNTVSINDSWVSADGGTQVKWVFCQDSASGTDGWVVGQILDQNASSLVGKYYIEYCGR